MIYVFLQLSFEQNYQMWPDVVVSSPSSYTRVSKFQYGNRGFLSWNICPDILKPLEKLPA